MIAVIDYDAGNICSVMNALNALGRKAVLTSCPKDVECADFALLPGVGSFGVAMRSLKERGLCDALKRRFAENAPTLGICLGLQLMFETSEESAGAEGLGFFKGGVSKLRCEGKKIPHIGWTTLSGCKGAFSDFENDFVYFVHSYAVRPCDESIIAARANYGEDFVAAVKSGNFTACQFHPEKSSVRGLKLLDALITEGGA